MVGGKQGRDGSLDARTCFGSTPGNGGGNKSSSPGWEKGTEGENCCQGGFSRSLCPPGSDRSHHSQTHKIPADVKPTAESVFWEHPEEISSLGSHRLIPAFPFVSSPSPPSSSINSWCGFLGAEGKPPERAFSIGKGKNPQPDRQTFPRGKILQGINPAGSRCQSGAAFPGTRT